MSTLSLLSPLNNTQTYQHQQVLPIPYTVVLLTAGLLIGFLLTFAADVHVNDAAHEHSRNIFVNSISTWVNM